MKVLYIAQCGLPDTAPGIRIYNIGKVLESIGYDVTFLCREFNEFETIVFQNLKYLFFKKSSNHLVNKVKHSVDSFCGKSTIKKVNVELSKEKYDAIFIYNDSSGITKKILKIPNVPKVFLDVTEWYSFSFKKSFKENIVAIRTNNRIKKIDNKTKGVICISNYLYDYYRLKKMNLIIIPPLVSFKPLNIKFTRDFNDHISLIYCGSPGEKDIIKDLIKAVLVINKKNNRILLRLIGISECQLKNKYRTKSGEKGIYAIGRIPHENVIKYYKKSDFSILLRKKKRYAMAGYSTKFAESMFYGVPVICNKVGGADCDIINDKNGFLVNDYKMKTLVSLFNSILYMDIIDLHNMKKEAYDFGKKKYSGFNYSHILANFLNYGDKND